MADLPTGFHCRICHRHHATLPLSFSVKAPDPAIRIPASHQAARVVLSPDQCVLDNAVFYLRGRIVIPIHGLAEPFVWGLWAEVSARDFYRTQQLWRTPGREAEPSFPGFLATELPLFPRTTNLPVALHTQPVGRRPHFQLLAHDHPLTLEQQHGIDLLRVQQIAETLLHPGTPSPSRPSRA